MSSYRVYIKTFDEIGNYLPNWQEVTEDCTQDDLSDIREILDDDEYNVGLFKNSEFGLSLKNENGMYSDPTEPKSMFIYRRGNSLVRITWVQQDTAALAGMFICGQQVIPNEEIILFTGLLNDDASATDIKDQIAHFKILGRESIFELVETPFASLANGQTCSQILQACLSVADITLLLTYVSGNIVPALDVVVDDVSTYMNSTIKDVLDDILKISGSVFYIKNDVMHVTSRAAGSNVATFYGQASPRGAESIMDLTQVKTGQEKVFNYWTWQNTALISKDQDSIDQFGVKPYGGSISADNGLSFDAITNPVTQQSILDSYRDEFGQQKASLILLVPMTPTYLAIEHLDKVSIDYPTVYYASNDNAIPIYGISRYGQSNYPNGVWSLTINAIDEWKVMGRSIKTKNQQIEFTLRRV